MRFFSSSATLLNWKVRTISQHCPSSFPTRTFSITVRMRPNVQNKGALMLKFIKNGLLLPINTTNCTVPPKQERAKRGVEVSSQFESKHQQTFCKSKVYFVPKDTLHLPNISLIPWNVIWKRKTHKFVVKLHQLWTSWTDKEAGRTVGVWVGGHIHRTTVHVLVISRTTVVSCLKLTKRHWTLPCYFDNSNQTWPMFCG